MKKGTEQPFYNTVLSKIQGETPKVDEKALSEFFKDVENSTTEVIEESERTVHGGESVENECDLIVSTEAKKETLEIYLEKVRMSKEVPTRSPMFLDRDIIDFLKPIKSKTGIPVNRLVETIVADWIQKHDVELQTFFYDKKKNKFIKDT